MSIELKHHHGGVSVPNLDESIEWYGKVLDFEVGMWAREGAAVTDVHAVTEVQ